MSETRSIPVLTQVLAEPQPLKLPEQRLMAVSAEATRMPEVKAHPPALEADLLWIAEHAIAQVLPPLMLEMQDKIRQQVLAEIAASLRR